MQVCTAVNVVVYVGIDGDVVGVVICGVTYMHSSSGGGMHCVTVMRVGVVRVYIMCYVSREAAVDGVGVLIAGVVGG